MDKDGKPASLKTITVVHGFCEPDTGAERQHQSLLLSLPVLLSPTRDVMDLNFKYSRLLSFRHARARMIHSYTKCTLR